MLVANDHILSGLIRREGRGSASASVGCSRGQALKGRGGVGMVRWGSCAWLRCRAGLRRRASAFVALGASAGAW
jgi:hypothetical protein